MHTQQSEKQSQEPREMTADEVAANAWWSDLPDELRVIWLKLCKGSTAAEAWAYYKTLAK